MSPRMVATGSLAARASRSAADPAPRRREAPPRPRPPRRAPRRAARGERSAEIAATATSVADEGGDRPARAEAQATTLMAHRGAHDGKPPAPARQVRPRNEEQDQRRPCRGSAPGRSGRRTSSVPGVVLGGDARRHRRLENRCEGRDDDGAGHDRPQELAQRRCSLRSRCERRERGEQRDGEELLRLLPPVGGSGAPEQAEHQRDADDDEREQEALRRGPERLRSAHGRRRRPAGAPRRAAVGSNGNRADAGRALEVRARRRRAPAAPAAA